jgi:hypothetical protein
MNAVYAYYWSLKLANVDWKIDWMDCPAESQIFKKKTPPELVTRGAVSPAEKEWLATGK